MDFGALQQARARSVLEVLHLGGVREVVVSPGSRSTPLILALEHFPRWPKHVITDERAAGFFALGRVRRLDAPVLLICTSGSAPAHYLPAVIEAFYDHHPLIVLSADRPPEEHDRQSHQTIDQQKLYGKHVKAFFDLGVAEANESSFPSAREKTQEACRSALSYPPGPVHLNAAFRKPLEPAARFHETEAIPTVEDACRSARAPRPIDREILRAMVESVERSTRGLVVAGPQRAIARQHAAAAHELCESLGYPLLAEGTSQWRHADGASRSPRIACFETLLSHPDFMRENRPEVILQIGRPPISSAYRALLEDSSTTGPPIERFVIHPFQAVDPFDGPARILAAPIEEFIPVLLEEFSSASPRALRDASAAWLSLWLGADRRAMQILDAVLRAAPRLTEARAVQAMLAGAPSEATWIAGNSLPIREIDWYGVDLRGPRTVICQRGAAGIDGLVAGAAGYAADAANETILMLGDLSLVHDLGALALAARVKAPLLIAVINNGGGRIFEMLPAAKRLAERGRQGRTVFEDFFLAPEKIDFAAAAKTFGLRFFRALSDEDIFEVLRDFPKRPGATLLEIVVDPSLSREIREEIFERTRNAKLVE